MKNLFVFILVFLQLIKVEAQNYKTVLPGSETYFINRDGYIKGIKIDTAVINGTDTVYYNFHSIRPDSVICPDGELTPYAPSWLGEPVIIKPDGRNLFFNKYSDTVTIQTLAALNDGRKLYQFPNGDWIEATVTAQTVDTVLGVADSVKNISLQVKDSSGNSILHPLNAKSFILSKNFGWTQTFNIYDFPGDTVQYNITDKKRLTVGEVYDFEVGDEIQVKVNHENYPLLTVSYALKKVLQKNYFLDSVMYLIKRDFLSYGYIWNSGWQISRSITSSSDSVTVVYGKINNPIFPYMPEEGFFPNDDLWEYHLSSAIDTHSVPRRMMSYYNYNRHQFSDSCWVPAIDGWSDIYFYIEGLGEIINSTAHPFSEYQEELIYYQKGTETYGQLFTAINEIPSANYSFHLYPNPAQDELLIECNFQPCSFSQIRIFDVLGNEVLKQPLNESKSKINIAALENGFYLVELNSEKGREIKKVIVQR